MATLLDLDILQYFGGFFVAMLAFVIIYGILEYIKPFGGDKKGLHGILALFIALLVMVSQSASQMVRVMVPWFIIIVVFIFFVLLMVRMFGVGESELKKVIADPSVYPWIIVFSLLVLIASLSAVFGQILLEVGQIGGSGNGQTPDGSVDVVPGYDTTSTSTPDFGTNVMNTLRHPKVMGVVFILLTGAFMLIFLTKPAKP